MSISKKKRAIAGFFTDFGGTLVVQLATLFVTPLYLSYTSAEVYGIWLIIGAILGWIILGELGIEMALTRSLITHKGINQKNRIFELTSTAILFFTSFGFILILAWLFYWKSVAVYFSVPINLFTIFRDTLLISLIAFSFKLVFSVYKSHLYANQYIAQSKINQTIGSLLGLLTNILCLVFGLGLLSFAFGMLVITVTNVILDIRVLYIKGIRLNYFTFSLRLRDFKELFSFGGYFQIGRLANNLMSNIDIMIIGAYLSSSMVSIYVFTSKLAFLICTTLVSKIPAAIFPGMSILFENKEEQKIVDIFQKLTVVCLRIGVVFATIYFIYNEEFIRLWIGKEYYGGKQLTIIFTIWIFIESFVRGITSILFSSNQIAGWSFISGIEAVINLFLSITLIDNYGLLGIAIATILSRLLTTVIFVPIKICKIIGFSFKRYFYDTILFTLILCLPSVIAGLTLDYLVSSLNIFVRLPLISFIVFVVNISLFEYRKLRSKNIKTLNELIINVKTFY